MYMPESPGSKMTKQILESISDGVFTVDKEWRITFFNRAAENITGISRDNALGSLCFEIFKSNMCEADCPLRKTFESGESLIDRKGYIITPGGERKPVSVSTALLYNEEGTVIGGAETFRDLSELEKLRSEVKNRSTLSFDSSRSPGMQRVYEIVQTVAPTDTTVLVQGESGSGKEVVARSIHQASGRNKGPFVAVNCGALPENLLESELFGYKKGAFTGADRDKPGRFALAKGGTLFLDEISEMSNPLQVKLLRVLQEKEFDPLGAVKAVKSECRIVCAANRNLKKLVQMGEFREDLFYRINVITLEIPPLRDRKEDIPLLAESFAEKFALVMDKKINSISPEVYWLFWNYQWPGNVRELENVMERAVLLARTETITKDLLPSDLEITPQLLSPAVIMDGAGPVETIKEARERGEREALVHALSRCSGNREEAAQLLGIDRATLYRKIAKYKL